MQNLQPQLMITMGEVSDLMVKIDKEKKEVVEPAAAAVAIDEAAAQEQADAAKGMLSFIFPLYLQDLRAAKA